MDDMTKQFLVTLGEAGGITGMIAGVLFMLIRLIKKNGCTFKCNSCQGKPIVEVDCEEGAPTARHFPPADQEG